MIRVRSSFVRSSFVYVAVLFIALLFASAAMGAPAQIRVLFLGVETDPGFAEIRAAAVISKANTGGKSPLLLRSLRQAFPEDIATGLTTLPPERVAQLARERWPKDDVFVITPNSAVMAGPSGLSVAINALVQANPSQRRTIWRKGHGVLYASNPGHVRNTWSVPNARPSPGPKGSLGAPAPTPTQSAILGVDSDECATFSRNGLTFDQPCGYGPGRGINIVVINQITGEIEEIYDFDTWIDPVGATQYADQFIAQIPPERLVLIAIADATYVNQVPALAAAFQQRFGSVCVAQTVFRDSWAAVSQNMKLLAEQCSKYSDSGDYVDSSVQYTLPLAPSSDATPPIGTFQINAGTSSTNSNLVTLDFTGITDAQSGLIPGGKVRLSNDGMNWSPMLDFSTSQNWVLDRGNGLKTIYAQFRDRAGNWTNTQTATIALDEGTPLRVGPNSVDFEFYTQYCTAGTTILALSASGSMALSPDLGSDWVGAKSVLTHPPNDYGYDQVFLSCGPSGAVLAAGVSTDESGNVFISTNSSSDTGNSWKPAPTAKSFAFTISATDYDYPSVANICSASPTNLVVFVKALLGQNDQIFAMASQDGGSNWPSAPAQLTNVTGSDYVDSSTLQTICNKSTVLAAVSGSNGLNVSRSINGGGAFAATNGPVASDAYDFRLVSDPNGELLLLTNGPSSSSSGYSLSSRRSRDGGSTWTLPVLVAQPLTYPNYISDPYSNIQAVAPAPGLAYVAWPEQILADGTEAVRITVSKDSGSTWSAPTSVAVNKYWYSFMLAERPWTNSFELAANANGDVEVVWVDDRQGLLDGYTVQRFGVSADARGAHEDSDIQGISDVYVAASTDFGTSWKLSGPLNPSINSEGGSLANLTIASDGTAIAIWEGDYDTYLDVRFLNGASTPLVDPGGPMNAASLMSGSLAPGSMAIISGQNLTAGAASGQPPALPLNLSDTSVSITDTTGTTTLAQLYSVALNQIRFVTPESTARGDAQMQITTSQGRITVPISVAGVTPGIFSIAGNAMGPVAGWIVQTFSDGSSQVTTISPALSIDLGANTTSVQLTVLATGVHHATNIKLMIGGIPADQVAVSENTGWPGLDQVSGLIAKSLVGAGTVNVYVVADSVSSNSLNVTFK